MVVTGNPMRDPASMTPAVKVLVPEPTLKVVAALTEIRRVRDGWRPGFPSEMRPPECRT